MARLGVSHVNHRFNTTDVVWNLWLNMKNSKLWLWSCWQVYRSELIEGDQEEKPGGLAESSHCILDPNIIHLTQGACYCCDEAYSATILIERTENRGGGNPLQAVQLHGWFNQSSIGGGIWRLHWYHFRSITCISVTWTSFLYGQLSLSSIISLIVQMILILWMDNK